MPKTNYEKSVTELYKKILLREPDKTSLYYFITVLEKKGMTIEDVKKLKKRTYNNISIILSDFLKQNHK